MQIDPRPLYHHGLVQRAIAYLQTRDPELFPFAARFDEARKRRAGSELVLVAQGKWPMSVVNPAVLQNTRLQRWQPIGIGRGPNS